MAKTIKFNLDCDNYSVRNLDDLRNHFSLEDILDYFDKKLLHKWLEVRGYEEELKKVNKITSKDSLEIAKELIKVFDIEADENKIKEDLQIINYRKDKEKKDASLLAQKNEISKIITSYKDGYDHLVDGICENANDISLIKANLNEIIENYGDFLYLDRREFFYKIKKHSTLALICALMKDELRDYFLPKRIIVQDLKKDNEEVKAKIANYFLNNSKCLYIRSLGEDDISSLVKVEITKYESSSFILLGYVYLDKSNIKSNLSKYHSEIDNKSLDELFNDIEDKHDLLDTKTDKDKAIMFDLICKKLKDMKSLQDELSDNLKHYKGNTESYWNDIGTDKDKRYMLIYMSNGAIVQSLTDRTKTYEAGDINNKFVILDGINFNSKSDKFELYYMEV